MVVNLCFFVLCLPCSHHISIWPEYREHYRTGTVHHGKEGSLERERKSFYFPGHFNCPVLVRGPGTKIQSGDRPEIILFRPSLLV